MLTTTFARIALLCLPLTAVLSATPSHAATPAAAKQTTCTARVTAGSDLQAAIDRLPANGTPATLCLGKGEFLLRKLVSIQRDNLHLRGQGAATVVRMDKGVQQPIFVIGDYVNQVPARRIRGVALEAMRIVGDATIEHEFVPERPYLSNSAVVIRGGEDIRLADLQVQHCRSACLLSEHNSHDIVLERNDVSGAIWDGVSFNRTTGVTMTGNHVHDNVAAGITVESLEDSVISDNRLERNGSQGIYLSDGRRNRFERNQFIDNTAAGVFLACSIRQRQPEILCWDDSMSRDNLFENNRFAGNPVTYTIGVDRAANCKAAGFKPNVWRNNQADASGVDIDPQRYGYCVSRSAADRCPRRWHRPGHRSAALRLTQ